MKLRVRRDSLRFRLTQGEVSRLLAREKVSESVHFSPTANLLTYSLQPSEQAMQVAVRFHNGVIVVDLPSLLVDAWANTDQVGIEYTQQTNEARGLRITIEKDFRCLLPRPEEDESDNFPHPQQAEAS